jgi:hypothetical protein
MQAFDLTQYGISGSQILRNVSRRLSMKRAIRFDHKASISAAEVKSCVESTNRCAARS